MWDTVNVAGAARLFGGGAKRILSASGRTSDILRKSVSLVTLADYDPNERKDGGQGEGGWGISPRLGFLVQACPPAAGGSIKSMNVLTESKKILGTRGHNLQGLPA